MVFNIRRVVAMALAVVSVSAVPINSTDVVELAAQDLSPLAEAVDFQFRFYDNGGCDHNSNPSDTWPSNGTPPGQGSYGACYSAPTGVNWNRVETDVFFPSGSGRGIQTFCNVNCGGGASVKQQNTNCYLPIGGCAIGSFKVIT